MKPFFARLQVLAFRLGARWKIYLSLTGILLPVFLLIIFVQQQVTRPLLEEEVRQIAISVSRSLATDIVAFQLFGRPQEIENRLIDISQKQASIIRIDVLQKEANGLKLIASNVAEENPPEMVPIPPEDAPISVLKYDENHRYWEILYPIRTKPMKKILGYVHVDVSLQLVNKVVSLVTKITVGGAVLAMVLLTGLLSYYLRRMIENERRLRLAESENLALTQQLNEVQRQLFLNEKLAIMGQLTASFAHEIGTPLNSLSGHLQLLKDEVPEENSRRRIEIINSQVSRIEGTVREFLASTHTPPQQRVPVDISEVLRRISNLVTPRLQKIEGSIQATVAPNVGKINIVPSDLEQVLLNLANNAIDALEELKQGEKILWMEASLNGSSTERILVIRVKDTGPGIPPDMLKLTLRPFFTTKAPGKGTGLGLKISQSLVKKYRGSLDIESALGKGTTVTVRIPYGAA